MFDDVEGIVRRQMVLFFCIDVSGSMEGEKIGTVNNTMREVLPDLKDVGGSDVELKIAVLKFSNGAEWVSKPVSVENFQWSNLETEEATSLGAACKELAKKMSKDEFLNSPSASVAPAVFLMSDGEPTDDFVGGVRTLKANKWFKYAIKVAVAIGDDANKDVLAEFTGSKEAVVTAHNPEQLKKWLRFVSVTSSQVGSKSSLVAKDGQPESKQDVVIEAIKQEQQTDAESATAVQDDSW